MNRVFYPVPGYLTPGNIPIHQTLMTDGCPTEFPSWYFVAVPVNHPAAKQYPDNLMSYCTATDAITAMSIYKELLANGEQVLGVVRVCEHGGAVEVRNEDRKTNGLAHHHEDFGSW